MRLASFPLMINVKTLLMGNNRICKIEKDLATYLPNLESLILTNNMIEQLSDLKPLLDLTRLNWITIDSIWSTVCLDYLFWILEELVKMYAKDCCARILEICPL